MKPHVDTVNSVAIRYLNSLLRGELSAVETYDQAIRHLGDKNIGELIANRNCHSKRVSLLSDYIVMNGGTPDKDSGIWGSLVKAIEESASYFSTKSVINALEEGEDIGLAEYKKPTINNPTCLEIINTELYPRQVETHERMRRCKLEQN